MIYTRLGKRILDLMVVIVASPIWIAVAIISAAVVRLTLGSPVVFRQMRPGFGGRPFSIFKFRTMTDSRDPEGRLLPDVDRLTSVGRFLRKTSLDELPELINVFFGTMSLVGPRPLLMAYLNRYSPTQARRHEVRPGITGWAQVNGRNALSWEEKFELDTWYVDHVSFWLDLKILLMTVGKVVSREGISGPGQATMSEFMGNEEGAGAGERTHLGDQ